jgi:hypothetical protein
LRLLIHIYTSEYVFDYPWDDTKFQFNRYRTGDGGRNDVPIEALMRAQVIDVVVLMLMLMLVIVGVK